ncbi:hypothetical protein EPK99_15115 [Neorhizobium lilium]|uniref:Uncharacterized protein n=1 Tax=Neorhizobium lilium TaxID=2503024 RepID=A0A444LFV0_9HYPH|nr:hypothetical protein [Neorhizobium lilium]RWX76991.1 hypothetical protein EPK99_15115 [Neorhizobium lilium]
MKKCSYSARRESILAQAIGPLASELRLIDPADLISLLRLEYHGNISDLVSSAAELYFHPGTVKFGIGGDYSLDWNTYPSVTLDLEIKPRGVTIHAQLTLEAEKARIEINYITFMTPSASPDENTDFLEKSLREATFVPSSSGMSRIAATAN